MIRAAVITVSDRSAAGERVDSSGPIAVAALREAGFDCAEAVVVADGADSVERALQAEIVAGVKLVVTTGGTGVGPRDETPEGTARVITREIPGIAEALRRRGVSEKPAGMLTRGIAGVVDPHGALVVNLPGSTAGVSSGMPVLLSVARHVIDQLGGGDH
ncbi:molybdenum cofactor synthesis domain-containing protein [Microbacterium sp. 2FI]|uniref:MogA/MoaB family molybdenum cofactor biosynthesis protein n=1 Tax=Microbacterium sp. 2FI TaxID=2502193 RepID=UPI0010F73554|nr:molybdenum cofactor synthesis domain-containing protein [Microbacterium sp. 2FI]